MSYCELRDSKVHGKGIFAKETIPANKVLFETHKKTSGALEWANLMPNFMYNHSDEPNCRSLTLGDFKYLVTLNEVQEGEELVVDYRKDRDLKQTKKSW